MIRAHTDSNQETWDIGLAQLTFAYNSSVHETIGLSPFEVMFGRQPRIPIDLTYPYTIDMTREPILDARTIQVEEVREQLTQVQPEVQEFDRLADATDKATPHHVQAFVTELKQRLETSFAWLESNKIGRMERAKVDYDRRIRKRSYEVGEWVLCNHPKIKKASQGDWLLDIMVHSSLSESTPMAVITSFGKPIVHALVSSKSIRTIYVSTSGGVILTTMRPQSKRRRAPRVSKLRSLAHTTITR